MEFRFRKSIKLFPGLSINVSKKGLSSITIGRRGSTLNVCEQGTLVTVGIPGTGISYSERVSLPHDGDEQIYGASSSTIDQPKAPSRAIERLKTSLIIALGLVIIALFLK